MTGPLWQVPQQHTVLSHLREGMLGQGKVLVMLVRLLFGGRMGPVMPVRSLQEQRGPVMRLLLWLVLSPIFFSLSVCSPLSRVNPGKANCEFDSMVPITNVNQAQTIARLWLNYVLLIHLT